MIKPKVVFVSVHNSCRSQVAEALGKYFAGDIFENYSTGTELKSGINPDAVRIIKNRYGIEMEQSQYPKLITDIPAPDIKISMGYNAECPYMGKEFDDNWELDDPTGQSDQKFNEIIDAIQENILWLMSELEAY